MAKGKPAKGPARSDAGKTKPAKSAGKAKPADAEQSELDLSPEAEAVEAEAPAAAPDSPAAPPKPAADQVVVVELVNGVDGVWKRMSNGKRVDLTTKEWRSELSRLFTRAPAP